MSPETVIGVLGAAFVATHLVLSHPPIRRRLVGRLGPWPYRALYSVVALAIFVPQAVIFFDHVHAGARIVPPLGPVAGHLADLMVAAGFGLFVGALISVPPSSFTYRGGKPRVEGMTVLTRHPVSMGITLWAGGHLIVNGWAADVAFYGTWVVLCLVGSWHQDLRLAEERDGYRELIANTTFFPWPFGKKLRGIGLAPALGAALGIVAAAVIRVFHDPLFS